MSVKVQHIEIPGAEPTLIVIDQPAPTGNQGLIVLGLLGAGLLAVLGLAALAAFTGTPQREVPAVPLSNEITITLPSSMSQTQLLEGDQSTDAEEVESLLGVRETPSTHPIIERMYSTYGP